MMTSLQDLTHAVRGNVLNRGFTTYGDVLGRTVKACLCDWIS